MTPEQRTRLLALKEKLKAREGKPGWKDSVVLIKAQIAEIENGS